MPTADRSSLAEASKPPAEPRGSTPLRAAYVIVDDFLPADMAEAMRQNIEAHFAKPELHRAETHQVWNYWVIPDLYIYLRTAPENIIQREHLDRFMAAMKAWSSVTLGMGEVTWPYLSLYVSGCRQGLHNDAKNGRFGFVYSLTRDQRRTSGGETIILHEGDLFRENLDRPAAGGTFFDKIEPRFNRLLVFDDRLPHAVERVAGSMDPIDGRLVLHGHIGESGGIVIGPLSAEAVAELVADAMRSFAADAAAQVRLYHGLLVLRFAVNPAGRVETCAIVVDRVMTSDAAHVGWQPLLANLIARFGALRFPEAEGVTVVTQPILFGGPLPSARF